jgi:hypothetical protein
MVFSFPGADYHPKPFDDMQSLQYHNDFLKVIKGHKMSEAPQATAQEFMTWKWSQVAPYF